MSFGTVANRRLLCAIGIVVALLAFISLSGAVEDCARAEAASYDSAEQSSLDASAALHEYSDPLQALAAIEEQAGCGAGCEALPAGFADQVALHPGAYDVRVGADGTVVGYCVDADAEDVLDVLYTDMSQLGWQGAPLGGVAGYTFMRSQGRYAWALITCNQVGLTTSVAVRVVER